jgi:Mu-like prophage I protein
MHIFGRKHHGRVLTLLSAQGIDVDNDIDLPTELKMLNWGVTPTRKGAIKFNSTQSDFWLAQNNIRYDGRIPIDFEHETVSRNHPEPLKLAGWGVPEVRENDGLYLTKIEWTQEGKIALQNKYYQDLSPAVIRAADGNIIGLHSLALCRHGEIEGIVLPYSADYIKIMDKLNKLMTLLGIDLADTADEATIEAALQAAIDKVQSMTKDHVGQKQTDNTITELSAAVKRLDDSMAALDKHVIISEAQAQGKKIPDLSVITALSAVQLKTMLQDAPCVVPLHASNHLTNNNITTPSIDPEILRVGELLGLSADQIKPYIK